MQPYITTIALLLLFAANSTLAQKEVSQFTTAKLCLMRGIWFNVTRDDIQNYMLVNGHKSLGISLSNENNLIDLVRLIVGFIDIPNGQSLTSVKTIDIDGLKENGEYYVWAFEQDVKNGTVSKPGFSISTGFYCDGKTLVDGANQPSEYQKVTYLSYYVISELARQGKADQRDYIEEFKIETLKAKVTADKTYFYTQPSEDQKRKAFLIKDDIAFVNTRTKSWIEVEFHGKAVTKGWIKASDLELFMAQ